MTVTNSDLIEKQVVLKAPISRVWRAISDAKQFGEWFGVNLDGEFRPGATVTGKITFPGYEHITLKVVVERVEPERHFSFRWHPGAIDSNVDYSKEPMTLVEFTVDEVDGGTKLVIRESGFDQLPLERRAEAFRLNDGGWTAQAESIEEYVARS